MLTYNPTQGSVRICPLQFHQVPILHLGMVRYVTKVISLTLLLGWLAHVNPQPRGEKVRCSKD